ncbi:MAG: pseudouridine synthase [Candidatus Cloacimonadaceae bacterium]|jgi:pseudouridine synthase|nr:rRNA pseudouridine synthase [Candidatus Cloacimonadota bacterium]MDX9949501.1 pseudouridine synthase [Candidatus Syntrophosphaera sp.]
MNSSRGSSTPSSKTASKPGEGIRLNRWLAQSGVCSRRDADELIRSGEVRVNGEICTDLSCRVDPEKDQVSLRGEELQPQTEMVYLMLNKPRGVLVTRADEFGRDTIYALLPQGAHNLRYAGRLDKGSEGLLLMTNDGELINALTHPKRGVEKVYRVEINRVLNKKELGDLRRGVPIEGGLTRPAGVFVKSQTEGGMTLKIVITEGRKRQIRQMLEAVGARVKRLKRLQFGTLQLKDLPEGRWRHLTPTELRSLKKLVENKDK